jgi:predicted Zn-dependent protease
MLSRCPADSFFVNSGVILQADNEAELASVMAHEIAHVAAVTGQGKLRGVKSPISLQSR